MSDIRLEIALYGSSSVKINEPIVLKAWITNISTHIVKIIDTHILREYEINVMFENGQPVPMTSQGNQLKESVSGPATFRRVIIDLDPGGLHQLASEMKLNEWFQLDRAGVYLVHIRQRDVQNDQSMMISNMITFTII